MKYFTLVVSLLFFNCSKNINQPIVDYSTDYATNDRWLAFSAYLKQHNQQTIVLINKKESDYNNLSKLIQKDKIKDLTIIKDSLGIQQMNYAYNKTKTIIIATKK